MVEKRKTCSSCIFYIRSKEAGPLKGTCHLNPPTVVVVDDGYGDATEIKSVHPVVELDNWCSHHKEMNDGSSSSKD